MLSEACKKFFDQVYTPRESNISPRVTKGSNLVSFQKPGTLQAHSSFH